jgi:hypothetical protein
MRLFCFLQPDRTGAIGRNPFPRAPAARKRTAVETVHDVSDDGFKLLDGEMQTIDSR